MSAAADLWRPLRTPIFRRLLIADVVSDVGTFLQGVGHMAEARIPESS